MQTLSWRPGGKGQPTLSQDPVPQHFHHVCAHGYNNNNNNNNNNKQQQLLLLRRPRQLPLLRLLLYYQGLRPVFVGFLVRLHTPDYYYVTTTTTTTTMVPLLLLLPLYTIPATTSLPGYKRRQIASLIAHL